MSRRKGSGKHTKEKVGDDEWNKHTKEKELVKEHRRKDTHGQDESQLDAERTESNAKAEPEKKKHFASGLLKWFAGSLTVDKTNNAGFALFGGKDGGEEEENEKEQIRYMHRGSETMSREEMLLASISNLRLAPSRPKSSRKMLIGR